MSPIQYDKLGGHRRTPQKDDQTIFSTVLPPSKKSFTHVERENRRRGKVKGKAEVNDVIVSPCVSEKRIKRPYSYVADLEFISSCDVTLNA